jgi:hypothetical protein
MRPDRFLLNLQQGKRGCGGFNSQTKVCFFDFESPLCSGFKIEKTDADHRWPVGYAIWPKAFLVIAAESD